MVLQKHFHAVVRKFVSGADDTRKVHILKSSLCPCSHLSKNGTVHIVQEIRLF